MANLTDDGLLREIDAGRESGDVEQVARAAWLGLRIRSAHRRRFEVEVRAVASSATPECGPWQEMTRRLLPTLDGTVVEPDMLADLADLDQGSLGREAWYQQARITAPHDRRIARAAFAQLVAPALRAGDVMLARDASVSAALIADDPVANRQDVDVALGLVRVLGGEDELLTVTVLRARVQALQSSVARAAAAIQVVLQQLDDSRGSYERDVARLQIALGILAAAGMLERADELASRAPEVVAPSAQSARRDRALELRTLRLLADGEVDQRGAALVLMQDVDAVSTAGELAVEAALASVAHIGVDVIHRALLDHVTGMLQRDAASAPEAASLTIRACSCLADGQLAEVRSAIEQLIAMDLLPWAARLEAGIAADVRRRVGVAHPLSSRCASAAARSVTDAGMDHRARDIARRVPDVDTRASNGARRFMAHAEMAAVDGSPPSSALHGAHLDVGDDILVVLDGVVIGWESGEDAPGLPLDVVAPGDAAWSVDGEPSAWVALTDVSYRVISRTEVDAWATTSAAAAASWSTITRIRDARMRDQLRRLTSSSHDTRVLELLRWLGPRLAPHTWRVTTPLTHQQIATACATRRVTVTQALGRLRTVGALGSTAAPRSAP